MFIKQKIKNKKLNKAAMKNGMITTFMYSLNTVFSTFAATKNTKAMAYILHSLGSSSGWFKGIWLTMIKETVMGIVTIMAMIIRRKNVKHLFRNAIGKAGLTANLGVFFNVVGNFLGAAGLIYVATGAFEGTISVSMLIFLMIGSVLFMKMKYSFNTLITTIVTMALIVAIAFIQTKSPLAGSKPVLGIILLLATQVCYAANGLLLEKAYRMDSNFDNDTALLIKCVSGGIFALTLGPILLLSGGFIFQGGIHVNQYLIFPLLFSDFKFPLLILGSAIVNVIGRNYFVASVQTSGGTLANIFYNGKMIMGAILLLVITPIYNAATGLPASHGMNIYTNYLWWITMIALFISYCFTITYYQRDYDKFIQLKTKKED